MRLEEREYDKPKTKTAIKYQTSIGKNMWGNEDVSMVPGSPQPGSKGYDKTIPGSD